MSTSRYTGDGVLAVEALRPVLIVEDLDADYEAAVRGLRRQGVVAPVTHCRGLREAEQFLRECRDAPERHALPGLIILDMRLPDGNGGELLEKLGIDPLFQDVPVVVWSAFTDPSAEEWISRHRGVRGCLRKAADRALNDRAMEHLARYWRQPAVSSPHTRPLEPDGATADPIP